MGYELTKPQVKGLHTMAASETVTIGRFTTMVKSYDDEILFMLYQPWGKALSTKKHH
jgi:hypothetical protein